MLMFRKKSEKQRCFGLLIMIPFFKGVEQKQINDLKNGPYHMKILI